MKSFMLLSLAMAGFFGCGLRAQETARRTVVGVSGRQVVDAAHRLLAEQGFEFDRFEPEVGAVATAWRDVRRMSVRYEVEVAAAGAPELEAWAVAVKAIACDRTVGGRSPEYPLPTAAADLLDDIVGLAPTLAAAPASAESNAPAGTGACARSSDCPPATHCGSGRCVAECAVDTECSSGEQCDRRGRCAAIPPPPPPPPDCPEPEPFRRGGR